MTVPKLREYQQVCVELAKRAFIKFKHVLLVSAQGSGKTFMFSYIALSAIRKGRKVLILTNRSKLLDQTDGALAKFGITAEYINPSHPHVPTGNCVVGTAQTLARRYQKPKWTEYLKSVDLLIIDEIHCQDFNFIFESGLFKDKWVLGVTATPKRSGKQRQLGLDFEVIVEGLSVVHGIELGFLKPSRHFTLDAPDLSKVPINSLDGDYSQTAMFKQYDSPKRYGGVIKAFMDHGNNDKTVCFCSSQLHAIKTCVEFNNAGIKAKFLISGLKSNDEDYHIYEDNLRYTGSESDIFKDWEFGDTTVVCNVAKYTTGADFPFVINIILNRATLSENLYIQMCGRGARPFDGKDFFRILDFGSNYERFGAFENPRAMSLWHDYKEGCGVQPTKECHVDKKDKNGKMGCGRLIATFYAECPFCGYVFKTPEELKEIELREIIGGKFKFKEMSAVELAAYAELNGYHKAWVFRQLWIGSDEKGFKSGMKSLGYESKFIYRMINQYKAKK